MYTAIYKPWQLLWPILAAGHKQALCRTCIELRPVHVAVHGDQSFHSHHRGSSEKYTKITINSWNVSWTLTRKDLDTR